MFTDTRNVFILLSSTALPYARICINSMLRNCVEPIHLRLVVDNDEEKLFFDNVIWDEGISSPNKIEIISKSDVSDSLSQKYPGFLGLLKLHEGHPCWRKIIDPIVLSEPDDEIIVIDPDVLFPNYFSFEKTPQDGVMMMRQSANCLYPPAAVHRVFEMGVPLANHVDIGVAQVRAGAIDLDWLDWFIQELDVENYTQFMHIEAIVWSALAMRMGGDHLSPQSWRCWERGKLKRVAVAVGFPGRWTLKLEPLRKVKCLHVSGSSKWWVADALETGFLTETLNTHNKSTIGVPYQELTHSTYIREQRLKKIVSKLKVFT